MGRMTAYRPYTLIAEITYRCPLHCVYCSNPVELARHAQELETDEWLRVFAEAAGLGVLQLHFTGGEPLARKDLEQLVRGAAEDGLYTNLITSGIPLTRERLSLLREAGLDAVQLSFQDSTRESADKIAGYPGFTAKLEAAEWIRAEKIPLTVNVVLHRGNLDRVEEIIALAERLGADRLELANTQYLGWALANREFLLPSRGQLERARRAAEAARARLEGKMEVLFVMADYFSEWPKACMDGWGRRYLHMSPDGLVLPCHAAHTIPGIAFESVRDRPLAEIWTNSAGFNMFRGEGWMTEPCRSCPLRDIDFGGCRCQAYHLAGDAAVTDPACSLSPHHDLIEAARRRADETSTENLANPSLRYRRIVPS
jgi:pyrroloquinoline quinone biosynthesis protein E